MDTRGSKRRLSNDGNDDILIGQESQSVKCAHLVNYNTNTQVMCTHGKHDEALKLGIVPSDAICHPCHDDL